ncbi:DEAD/DEAH box helicase [Shigella flexneri]
MAARSEHALVIAPTGSGKTLAAFLYALDRLFREGGEDTREAHKRKTSRILYISPIKALGTDVQRNLQLPLKGIADERRRRGETVIIDEVHAVAGSKRGAHLALSLERLDALLHTSAQRIGLSATVRSASDVAAFLGGDCPVTVVNPPAMRHPQIRIVVPVAIWMMSHRSPAAPAKTAMPAGKAPSGHILKRVSLMKCCAIARPLSLLIHVGWRKTDGTIK